MFTRVFYVAAMKVPFSSFVASRYKFRGTCSKNGLIACWWDRKYDAIMIDMKFYIFSRVVPNIHASTMLGCELPSANTERVMFSVCFGVSVLGDYTQDVTRVADGYTQKQKNMLYKMIK